VTEAAVVNLRAFFEEARAGRLTAIRCGQCGALAIPPREFCPACHARAWSPVPLRGEGTIASFTVIRIAPRGFAGTVPYAIASVQLAEGVCVLGRLVDVPLDQVRVGLAVRFIPIVEGEQTAVGFTAS
jgi:uncharacterized OB-fold protein